MNNSSPSPVHQQSNNWTDSKVLAAVLNSTAASLVLIGAALYLLVELVTGQVVPSIPLTFYALAVVDSVMRYRQLKGKGIPFKKTYRKFSSWEDNTMLVFQVSFIQVILGVFVIVAFLCT